MSKEEKQLDLFPELNTSYTLDTNGTFPLTYNIEDITVGTEYTLTIDQQMSNAIDLTDNIDVKIYKLFPEAHMPELGTEWAACFDLKASMREGDIVTVITSTNKKRQVSCHEGSIDIYNNERVLVPTGLVFDLDDGQSMRIHPRSGLAWKKGITLANCEGVVDADYVQQTYVMLYNLSDEVFTISDGDRIAQGEVLETYNKFVFEEVFDEPAPKTSRTGGFGSTGV